jgi:hypothetical protein
MSVNASLLGQTLCPDAQHRVFAGDYALEGLQQLSPEVRCSLVQMLCEVSELAEVRPSLVEFWDDEPLLRLRVGEVMALYTVDRDGAVRLHRVFGDLESLTGMS